MDGRSIVPTAIDKTGMDGMISSVTLNKSCGQPVRV